MDLAEFRCTPYGKALKRLQTRGAKAATNISIKLPIDNRELLFYNTDKGGAKNA